MVRAALLTSLLLSLAACGPETQPRLGDAGPRPAEISTRSPHRPGASGAVLVATGRQSFEGTLPVRCAVHDGNGLQINLRTGDSDLPAVAVRIDELNGSGPHRGRLFVTGRNRAGALAGSAGEATVELTELQTERRESGPAEGPLLLEGSFAGTYQGAAGKGSIEGRFQGCAYPLRSDSSQQAFSSPTR
ncbi:MAG TPA: hypothetical protein VN493_02435 [Thermoanaerobaculia bacterium]|nr:hypothetical protein [Thermoanaerobaculia bacterium]